MKELPVDHTGRPKMNVHCWNFGLSISLQKYYKGKQKKYSTRASMDHHDLGTLQYIRISFWIKASDIYILLQKMQYDTANCEQDHSLQYFVILL